MEYLQDIVKNNKEFLEKYDDNFASLQEECDDYVKEIGRFLETDNADFFKPINSGKENVKPSTETNKRRGRSRRAALADVTENNTLQTETLKIKKEKISDIQEINEDSNVEEVTSSHLNIKIKEEMEKMPAPTKLPPRKKKIKTEKPDLPKRSTRTRTKKVEATDESNSDSENIRSTKDSDVIIQNTTITTIDLSDNEKETDTESNPSNNQGEMRVTRSKMRKPNKQESSKDLVKEATNKDADEAVSTVVRNTRTKTRQKKRNRSGSEEHPTIQTEKKRSKSDSNKETEHNESLPTDYEDAVSILDNNQDARQAVDTTYIASSKIPSSMNSTITVEKPKMVTGNYIEESCKLPEDEVDTVQKPSSKTVKKNGTKQIFSPFEKTPVKKKVEAFEKLGVESKGAKPRKIPQKEHKERKETKQSADENGKHSVEKEKLATPTISKFIPKVCSTSKISKQHPMMHSTSTSSESILSAKSASALKASQAEFREREKRRQEKEREALRKREALLLAQTEEKRRKREEKQQRAQQQREILEKEMQKQAELQRVKEEKFKHAMAEREKKLQKQKEESEKKRLMVKKKADELLKEKEETIRIAEQKKYAEMKPVLEKQGEMAKLALKQKIERQQQLPIYMVTKPPLLPTVDCYDSDDPEYENHKWVEPAWSKERELRETQLVMITVGETIKNSFFCRQAQTPDLQEIFEIIDPRKLKRTSSAIWRKPPRYTLMPTLDATIEFSEDSD